MATLFMLSQGHEANAFFGAAPSRPGRPLQATRVIGNVHIDLAGVAPTLNGSIGGIDSFSFSPQVEGVLEGSNPSASYSLQAYFQGSIGYSPVSLPNVSFQVKFMNVVESSAALSGINADQYNGGSIEMSNRVVMLESYFHYPLSSQSSNDWLSKVSLFAGPGAGAGFATPVIHLTSEVDGVDDISSTSDIIVGSAFTFTAGAAMDISHGFKAYLALAGLFLGDFAEGADVGDATKRDLVAVFGIAYSLNG